MGIFHISTPDKLLSIMRTKDNTLITCKLCKDTVRASGMGSHLYHKHDKTTSDKWIK